MTTAEVQVRAEAARKFLEVARMVEDDASDPALPRVASALAVLSGVAASGSSRAQHTSCAAGESGVHGSEDISSAVHRRSRSTSAAQPPQVLQLAATHLPRLPQSIMLDFRSSTASTSAGH